MAGRVRTSTKAPPSGASSTRKPVSLSALSSQVRWSSVVDFYSTLFNTTPVKRRPGYANFAVDNPGLKLVLFENPEQTGTLNHLGVEVNPDATLFLPAGA